MKIDVRKPDSDTNGEMKPDGFAKTKNMKLIVKLTNQGALRSGEDIEGNQYTFDCEPGYLPDDVRRHIAARLYEDTYLCVAVLNKDGIVESSVSNGGPDLLLVDGTDVKDLI